MKRRIVLVMAMATTAGCASLFGIDEPQREECAGGACDDASLVDGGSRTDSALADTSQSDGDSETVADTSAPDQAVPTGIRCGDVAALSCAKKTVCCLSEGDGGASYACTASVDACAPGYAIECAGAKDCLPGDVCCHFHSATKCLHAGSCSGELVCDPSGDDCPVGKACDVPVIDLQETTPYLSCRP